MKFDGVIFDFNGTLLFDDSFHQQAWSDICMELKGHPLTMDELRTKYLGMNNREMLEKMCPELSTEENEKLSYYKESLYRKKVAEMEGGPKLEAGAELLFDWLKDHQIPFTIATASIKPNVDFFIQTFHLDHWINTASIVYDDGLHADKKSMYEDAVLRIGAENVLIFEDSKVGIEAASSIPGAFVIAIEKPGLELYYKTNAKVIMHIHDYTDVMNRIEDIFEGV